jgi:hypothetical protein
VFTHLGLAVVYLEKYGSDSIFRAWVRITLIFDIPAKFFCDYFGVGYLFEFVDMTSSQYLLDLVYYAVISLVGWYLLGLAFFLMYKPVSRFMRQPSSKPGSE